MKAAGSGHSFTDIACTSGVQVSLDGMTRFVSHDPDSRTATVEAGISLRRLGNELAARGLALENLGDVAYQTLAGAISTATHGTGARFGGLATQVEAIEIVTGDGSVLRCSRREEPEVFDAARVGLGALGVLSTVTLRCVPAFNLRAVEAPMRLEDALDSLDALVGENDHFEMYWVPHTGWALTKSNNRTEEEASPRNRWRELRDRVLLENIAFGAVCRVGRARPEWIPSLARTVPSTGRTEFVDRSDKVFTSPRWVHFCEMEYSIPREEAADAIRRLRELVDGSGLRISFPVEVRFTAADDVILSTANGRDSCYIAVHMYRGTPYEQYFRGVEAIMGPIGGRPHWGKLHFQSAATLAPRYPAWDRFQAVRRKLDPEGVFSNAYIDRVLGPLGAGAP